MHSYTEAQHRYTEKNTDDCMIITGKELEKNSGSMQSIVPVYFKAVVRDSHTKQSNDIVEQLKLFSEVVSIYMENSCAIYMIRTVENRTAERVVRLFSFSFFFCSFLGK